MRFFLFFELSFLYRGMARALHKRINITLQTTIKELETFYS